MLGSSPTARPARLVNRMPTVLTLRPRLERYEMVTDADGVTRYKRVATEQTIVLIRLAYFIVIGWWLSENSKPASMESQWWMSSNSGPSSASPRTVWRGLRLGDCDLLWR